MTELIEWTGYNSDSICEFCESLVKYNTRNPNSPPHIWFTQRGPKGVVHIRRKDGGFNAIKVGDFIIKRSDNDYRLCTKETAAQFNKAC